jgi:hypothetical protein
VIKVKPKSIDQDGEDIEALKRALIGVKCRREEAFILLNAVPEEYLDDIVEYFRVLTGINRRDGLELN